MQPVSQVEVGLDVDSVWGLLTTLAGRASAGRPLLKPEGVRFAGGVPSFCEPQLGQLMLRPDASYRARAPLGTEAAQLLALCLPLCVGARACDMVVAHLGQSLDGRICTQTGDSQFITGPEDLTHTHRLRALCDAVVVGARTVEFDDPQLTTRRVPGANPVRVAVDPGARVPEHSRILADAQAPTLLLRSAEAQGTSGKAEVITLPAGPDGFDVRAVLSALRARGLRRIFVEGGGITVSRFLRAGALHRLHLAIAPVVIGSGDSALTRDPIDSLSDALRLPAQSHRLGNDVLFDCDLSVA